MSLWSELKQRRITQVVFAYLAGGYLVLTVIDQVVDREVLPLVVYQVALTVYLVGILAALIVGWYHGELGEQKAPLKEIVMLSIVGIIALGTSAVVIRNAMDEATLENALIDAGTDLRRLAVLYFEDGSRDGSLQAVAEGITEGLIDNLVTVRELDVKSRNVSREVREMGDVPIDSIASHFGVGAVIDGSVTRSGDDISVTVRLLEGTSGAPLSRETYSWPADSLASVGSELAAEVANVLRRQIGGEIRVRESRRNAPNSAAWLQVARAERYLKDAERAVVAGDVDALVAAFDAADTELAAAQESAPEWAEPLVLRARVAYEWYVLLGGNIEELIETLDLAVEYATAALALDPNNAGALEWRGTALYRRWLTRWDDGADADAVLAQAQADLERAETLDPSRASVPSTLSHLLYQVDDWSGAFMSARRAYQQDAFLDVADGVLWRLYTAAYDLGEFEDAQQWCEEGYDRFPHNFRFVQCRIYLMTMPDAEPDIELAWDLYAELEGVLTERPGYHAAQAKTMIGGIIGRAGLPDSANAVFQSARVDRDVDPDMEIMSLEAAMRSVMGDAEGAITTLERFMVGNEYHAPGRHWWWESVEGDPRFERLQAQH